MSDIEDTNERINMDDNEDQNERRVRRGLQEEESNENMETTGNEGFDQSPNGLVNGNMELFESLNIKLDVAVFNDLKTSTMETAKRALTKFKDTPDVRNPNSYMAMLLRRYKGQPKEKFFEDLPQSIQDTLNEICEKGRLCRADLDDRVVGNLHSLSEEAMSTALEKYRAVDERDMQKPEGFLNSAVRRMINIEKQGSNGNPPQEVLDRIAQAIKDDHIKEGELDSRCFEALSEFDAPSGLAILDQLLSSNLGNVKNMGGYFLGIIKRFKQSPAEREREDRRRSLGGGRGGRRGDRRGGDRGRRDDHRPIRGGHRDDRGYGRPMGNRRDEYGGVRDGGYRDSRGGREPEYRNDRDYDSGHRELRSGDRSYDYRDPYENRGYERGGYDRTGYERSGYDRGCDRPGFNRPIYDRYPPR